MVAADMGGSPGGTRMKHFRRLHVQHLRGLLEAIKSWNRCSLLCEASQSARARARRVTSLHWVLVKGFNSSCHNKALYSK